MEQDGFSLIELLVVVIIIGILAAIAIPRYLEQRQAAWNSAAVADLRNLAAIQTSLEAAGGMSETPADVAAEGWEPSLAAVVSCADVQGADMILASWHVQGSVLYTWRRSESRVVATPGGVPSGCADAIPGGSPTQLTS